MVPFRLAYEGKPAMDLQSPLEFPKDSSYSDVLEPTVNCTIITPEEFTGAVLQLCASRRGDLLVCPLICIACDAPLEPTPV
jgi:translation elongation factor EF-4